MFQPSVVYDAGVLFVTIPFLNRMRANPMFQFVFEATLFQLRARTPSCAPLLQLPNRSATERQRRMPAPLMICNFLFRGNCASHTPEPPNALTRGSILKKEGEPEVPVRIRGDVVPAARANTVRRTVVAVAEPKRHGRLRTLIICYIGSVAGAKHR